MLGPLAQRLSRLTGLTPTHIYIAAAAFGIGLSAFNVAGTVAAELLGIPAPSLDLCPPRTRGQVTARVAAQEFLR
jgi:hypothetical protein